MAKPLVKFIDTTSLDKKLAQNICTILEDEIHTKGYANLALSGGSTPLGLFKLLAQQDIAWHKVNITLADERCVEPNSANSNARMLEAILLNSNSTSASANFMPLFRGDGNDGSDECKDNSQNNLNTIEQNLLQQQAFPFDVLVLGMGEDGHTASLFPCAKTIKTAMSEENRALLNRISPTSAPYERITFTFQALQKSKKIFLHLVGSAKLATLTTAEHGNNILTMPIRAFLQDPNLNLEIYWAPQITESTQVNQHE